MNRRKMLTLTSGIMIGSFLPVSVKAEDFIPWLISDEDLNTAIVLPPAKKDKKSITTNRFNGDLSSYAKIIKIAESVYPLSLWDSATENGKPLWYLNDERKTPYNVTSRAVNHYFNLAPTVKNAGCRYNVEVNQLYAITKSKTEKGSETVFETIPEEVNEVVLTLGYGYVCGKLCCYSFERKKKVIFNQSGQIVSLYMPGLGEMVC